MPKIYVWDRCWAGAFIIVASSAQAAADKWNAQYPKGIYTRHGIERATAESFEEHNMDEVVTTLGDD